MSGHTKGPWHLVGVSFLRDGNFNAGRGTIGHFTLEIACDTPLYDLREVKQKAAIAIAAPDLLEALEGMMKCFDDGVGEHWNEDELDAARAAIAKARGEA